MSSSLSTRSWNLSQVIKKYVNNNNNTGVSLSEKQNWYYRDHLERKVEATNYQAIVSEKPVLLLDCLEV